MEAPLTPEEPPPRAMAAASGCREVAFLVVPGCHLDVSGQQALSITSSRRATSQPSHRSPLEGHSCIGTSRTTATLPSTFGELGPLDRSPVHLVALFAAQ